ncbi:TPA: hypothetical protein ACGJSI_004101 [Pseudomonas aeruginosa]|jgi:hypothetical protein|uniref:Uncharacterized protein n=4 Tax=root TaxID=1 RepID=A0A6H1QAD6_PSEAI|nr:MULTISPECIES: hypothetical protein [Pseudomonas]MCQ1989248.1 hypothetical protein [Pseudomonas sp. Eb3]MDP9059207.1 hypothetical protein [Pseudomonadota bacterium]MDY7069839.1 hypothetical protein [Pseudomonas extremaustralis]MDY7074903.1 hypothetical protein [Pseudomonas hunanensis]TCT89952.1 hypothetical protein EC913_12723 [Pseudomonas sp. LP_4_YM]
MIAECIGCGCTDMCACVSEDGPCYWLRVDYSRGEGVCSCCSERVAEWDAEIGRKSIDDQFIELMDALDGYDSPEAISQRLAELQGPIRELAAACRQTVLFNRAQVEFQSTKTDIELRPMEGGSLFAVWYLLMDRIARSPTKFHMRSSVRILLPLVADFLPEDPNA